MNTPEEAEWIAAAQGGDLESFGRLVSAYQQNVRACLAVRMDRPHDAEDLAQEVFVIAFRKLVDFDPDRPFGPWLRGIAFNLLRNYWRKFKAEPIGGGAELDALVDRTITAAHTDGTEHERLFALKQCLAQLDPDSRALVKMRYADERPIADLMEHYGKKHSAVTMRLHRLRSRLAECIERRVAAGLAS